MVIEANVTRDTELFSKMDLFTEIKFMNDKQRTKVADEAGKTPKWNQELIFTVNDQNGLFHIAVYDEDIASNDVVGEMQISAKDLIKKGQAWHPIYYKN